MREFEKPTYQGFSNKSMIFGSKSSSLSAHYVKNTNHLRFLSDFPKAFDVIIKNNYIDDYIDWLEAENDGIQRTLDVNYTHLQ